MFEFEEELTKQGYLCVAGMDEAGRGPLAGSVFVAICVMPLDDIINGIDDSKKLTAKKREMLFEKIVEKAKYFHIEEVDVCDIDNLNILNATKKGMKKCVESLKPHIDYCLIDYVNSLDIDIDNQKIVKGDSKSYSIACASILAKVARDRYMQKMHILYPQYAFDKHKGYGTKLHIENLKKFGKCPIHRKLFIRNFVGENEQ